MMSKIEKIQEVCLKHNVAFYLVKTKQEAHDVLLKANTRFYCYALICDDVAIIVGKGSNRIDKDGKIQTAGRNNIIFPGGTAFGHQKAMTAALGHMTGKQVFRFIVPATSSELALKIENELKSALNFGAKKGGKSVKDLNEQLLDKRLTQLYPGLDIQDFKSTEDYKKFRYLIKDVVNPTGCEMANFKSDIHEAEKLFYPGLVSKVQDIFGGYFSDL